MRHDDFDAHMQGLRSYPVRRQTPKRELFRVEYLALVPILAILALTVYLGA